MSIPTTARGRLAGSTSEHGRATVAARRPPAPAAAGGSCPSPGRRRERGPEGLDPAVLFARLLDGTLRGATVRTRDGQIREVPVDRWLRRACPVDERVLDRAVGAVLDVGCGPGRHLLALGRRGVRALGVELSAGAARHARAGGASVVLGSIFDVALDATAAAAGLAVAERWSDGGREFCALVPA